MRLGKLFIAKGPVHVDGHLAFTATRDLYVGDIPAASDIIRPDGTTPGPGDAMTSIEDRVFNNEVEFTHGTDR